MIPGRIMLKGCKTANNRRLFHSTYKNKLTSKKKQKIIQGKKKSTDDKHKETEGTVYKAGAFH